LARIKWVRFGCPVNCTKDFSNVKTIKY